MNDPNKVINVNLSSLLSLKAELLRKQAEVSKAKVAQSISSTSGQEYVANTSQKVTEDADDTIYRKKKDKKKVSKEIHKEKEATTYEHEDSAMLEKSQRVLQAKAKFYERMQKTGGKLNSDDNCLVMFNKKKQEDTDDARNEPDELYNSSDDSSGADLSDHLEVPDDEWVEYTDCLGRTRTCLKRDLEEAKRKDEKLAASMPERLDQTKANWLIDTKGSQNYESSDENDEMIGPMPPQSVLADGFSIMSKHEEQKANWERKEQENLDKTDVHYQDVFFDEARQHGVGYYAFSTDEEERRKQQIELEKVRQETIDEQQKREVLKAQREKIIAERVWAAKNRQRVRLGLPPLEKEEAIEKKEEPTETKEERKARKKAEKLEKLRLKEEEEREKERLNHIRPWDKEKEGVAPQNTQKENEEWEYKPEREPMTQEQWNEYKRNERLHEFAPPAPPPPPPEKPLKRTNFNSTDSCIPTNYNNVPPPDMNKGFSKFQSTKKKNTFKRRNYTEATPPINEELPSSSNSYKTGVCIPPPSNLEDLFLPSQNKKAKSSHELEKSIEAGLRFLRNNCDKEMPATKSSWTAKADY